MLCDHLNSLLHSWEIRLFSVFVVFLCYRSAFAACMRVCVRLSLISVRMISKQQTNANANAHRNESSQKRTELTEIESNEFRFCLRCCFQTGIHRVLHYSVICICFCFCFTSFVSYILIIKLLRVILVCHWER